MRWDTCRADKRFTYKIIAALRYLCDNLDENNDWRLFMLIAVSAGGRELLSAVSKRFETCRWLLFVETDDMTIDAVRKTEDILPETLAKMIAERDCEAVITGSFTPEIFNIIADACVTRYRGTGLAVKEAIARMENNTLEYIRNADGIDTCQSDHGGGECDCGEHD